MRRVRLFISHASRDKPKAVEIAGALADAGFECWLDSHQIELGEEFILRIAEGLRNADFFVLLDSVHARNSYWVNREIGMAKRLVSLGIVESSALISVDSSAAADEWYEWKCNTVPEFLSWPRLTGSPRKSPTSQDKNFVSYSGFGSKLLRPELRVDSPFQNLASLDSWFHSSLPYLWLMGPTGIGKSTLIYFWLFAIKELGFEEPLELNVLHESVSDQDTWSTVSDRLKTGTDKCAPLHLLILDNSDRLLESGSADALQWIIERFDRVVFTASEKPPFEVTQECVLVVKPPDMRKMIQSRLWSLNKQSRDQ